MRIEQIMSQPAITCREDQTLSAAAGLMWDHDCGVVPIVGDGGVVVGMLTDRDICMAAYTQGKPLHAIPVSTAMASRVFSCHPEEPLEAAEALMAEKQVRRVPVVDAEGRPVGVLSLNDLVRRAESARGEGTRREIVKTLAGVCQPRSGAVQTVPAPVVRRRQAPPEAAL
jgi:CBS domain-containing protein